MSQYLLVSHPYVFHSTAVQHASQADPLQNHRLRGDKLTTRMALEYCSILKIHASVILMTDYPYVLITHQINHTILTTDPESYLNYNSLSYSIVSSTLITLRILATLNISGYRSWMREPRASTPSGTYLTTIPRLWRRNPSIYRTLTRCSRACLL